MSFCTKEEVQRLQVQHDVDDDGDEGRMGNDDDMMTMTKTDVWRRAIQ